MIKKIVPMISTIVAAFILQFMPLSNAQAGICALSNASAINVTVGGQIQLTPSTSIPALANVLYSGTFATSRIAYTCTGSTVWESAYSRGYTSTSQSHIYNTEIPGIGIRVKWPSSFSDSFYVPATSAACVSSCSINADTITLEFIHIGAVNEGEQIIPAGEIAKAYFLNDNGTLQLMTLTLAADVIISPRSCSIFPSSNRIDLGDIDVATLSTNGQGKLVDFHIHVSCPVASSVGITFESSSNVFGTGTGDIGASSGSVSGLSVRVYINTISSLYSALTLERTYSFTNVLERSIPMRAQLYVKDPALFASSGGPGTVESNLLYTMTIR